MGLRRAYIDLTERLVESTIGEFAGTKMLELGNQRIHRNDGIPERTGKAYFTNRGVEHTSIDFNGKDGALPLDLSKQIYRPEWHGYFDIITNFGTTEHVEPMESQFTCFRNLHTWAKLGGIMIHIVPAVEELESAGHWRNHCNIYYSMAFFNTLAELNNYDLIESTVLNDLRTVCLRKREESAFTDNRAALLSQLTVRDGGIEYSGVDDRNQVSLRVFLSAIRKRLS